MFILFYFNNYYSKYICILYRLRCINTGFTILSLSLSLSLFHTHTHANTNIFPSVFFFKIYKILHNGFTCFFRGSICPDPNKHYSKNWREVIDICCGSCIRYKRWWSTYTYTCIHNSLLSLSLPTHAHTHIYTYIYINT